ncbi:hypothetical protein [Acinetobacter sp. MD2(2019)]|uniref:hypothetical protein n=1 Tax=Acinetobacter sp. MD2(2019) TaxID=2605273 RepID=UPI002D1EEF62|nr:hypothetical protein [Acinetobacter sp. MD2(2019)]MEB3753629.1 hypothetical protein [Acinetobacter sp. MD2(2019)]
MYPSDSYLHFKSLLQSAVRLLIAFAFGCFSVLNAFAQSNHPAMQNSKTATPLTQMHHASPMPPQQMTHAMADCAHHHSDTNLHITKTVPTTHPQGCFDCQLMHCQTLNYALLEPSINLTTHAIIQEKALVLQPDAMSHVLAGYWQEILRPPRA